MLCILGLHLLPSYSWTTFIINPKIILPDDILHAHLEYLIYLRYSQKDNFVTKELKSIENGRMGQRGAHTYMKARI